MPVLNLHNFSPFFFNLVHAVEEGALILKQRVYQHYNMLNCDAKERFR